jgi:site-specific DNA-methyltransferase (adenine-specific)
MSELYHNHFQNFKVYQIPKAQLIIADIPYNLGNNAYASNPAWYKDGDNSNGESELAGKEFFDTDKDFRPAEFMHFCSTMLKKEPPAPKSDDGKRQKSNAPCMIVFCEFEQQFSLIELAKRYGLNRYINLVFRKNFSAQVLKANMKIVGNCEYGLLLYRDRLPKFNNNGKMVFNCIDWERDEDSEKLHPTQKPVKLLKKLIEIFTDPGDVVIDPCAGSGSTLVAAIELDRKAYGFEIKRNFHADASKWIKQTIQRKKDIKEFGFNKTETEKVAPTLF